MKTEPCLDSGLNSVVMLAIYGAQGYALGACEAIRTLYPKREISGFLVTRMEGNVPVLGGIPVRELSAYAPFARHAELMKLFHARLGRFLPLAALPVGCHMPFVRMYMAKSHVDKPLRNSVPLPDYVFPIQAGAACCGVRVADLADNTGDHISDRNGNYCELTALYWVWKNKMEAGGCADGEEGQYYGLCQYRRGFDLKEDDLLRLADNDVDAVLPYPLPYEPNIHAHHERYIKEADWKALLRALEELQPSYAEAFPEILSQRYLYNYNVILAKKSVLRDYCAWLFPILMRTEELSVPKGNERRDRYLGYMGETLLTLYFMKNAEWLNVVHVECRILT